MYLNYDYEGGDWDKSYKLRKPVLDKEYYNNFGNYKNTHSIIKYNTDHGYVLLAPKERKIIPNMMQWIRESKYNLMRVVWKL